LRLLRLPCVFSPACAQGCHVLMLALLAQGCHVLMLALRAQVCHVLMLALRAQGCHVLMLALRAQGCHALMLALLSTLLVQSYSTVQTHVLIYLHCICSQGEVLVRVRVSVDALLEDGVRGRIAAALAAAACSVPQVQFHGNKNFNVMHGRDLS